MAKDKFYDEWEKIHWHRLRKWAETKNSGEFSIVFEGGLPVRIKSKVMTNEEDSFTEVTVRHKEVDLTKETE